MPVETDSYLADIDRDTYFDPLSSKKKGEHGWSIHFSEIHDRKFYTKLDVFAQQSTSKLFNGMHYGINIYYTFPDIKGGKRRFLVDFTKYDIKIYGKAPWDLGISHKQLSSKLAEYLVSSLANQVLQRFGIIVEGKLPFWALDKLKDLSDFLKKENKDDPLNLKLCQHIDDFLSYNFR